MKNLVAVVFLLCLVCTFAPAQSPRQMQAGFTLGYDHYNFTSNYPGGTYTDDRGNIVVGAFLDAIYLRVIAEYQRALSGTIAQTGYVTTDYPSGFSVSFINFQALGKYPIQLGTTTIWPAIGVRYSHPLAMTAFGVDALANSTTDVADFYLCFGGGIDFKSGNMIIGVSALYDYSLTPSQTNTTLAPAVKVSGFDFEVALNVGFAF